MKTTITILLSALLLALPVGSMAASQEGGGQGGHSGHSGHEMSQEGQAMQHGGMMMGGGMCPLHTDRCGDVPG